MKIASENARITRRATFLATIATAAAIATKTGSADIGISTNFVADKTVDLNDILSARRDISRAIDKTTWSQWKSNFVSQGRVVDTGNEGVTHSEGQSYGLLFSEYFGDRSTFDSVLDWSKANLCVRSDNLMAWRWRAIVEKHVEDRNNATDGDLIFAWALIRAAHRWSDPSYLKYAESILNDISRKNVTEIAGLQVLIPGAIGFQNNAGVTINPSYYAFAALNDFEKIFPDGPWGRLSRDGIRLLEISKTGPYSLPPDWVQISRSGSAIPAPDRKPHFSWDAIRVPLHLAWAGMAENNTLKAINAFWAHNPKFIPTRVELRTGTPLEFGTSVGFDAIAQLTSATVRRKMIGPQDLPKPGNQENYYSASLCLLSHIASSELKI